MKCQQCFFPPLSLSLTHSIRLCLSLSLHLGLSVFFVLCTFLTQFEFQFGVLESWEERCIVLRHECGRKCFGNWNDLKSPPTYIHDIFCVQFEMPSCATAQKTDTIWRWNVNVYCVVAEMPTAAVASAMVTATVAAMGGSSTSTEEIIATDCCCCCCCYCKCERTNKWWNCLVSLLAVLGTVSELGTSKQVNIEDGKFIFP